MIREKKYQSDGRVVGESRAMGGPPAQGGRGHSQGGQRETKVKKDFDIGSILEFIQKILK